ncbi:MAG TPA: class I SAM-dependent methyltransferase [Solirubrobacterales bacterium]|nr:class I SAM-dependent methyltransferase [Solirubrobacterales bacterium]
MSSASVGGDAGTHAARSPQTVARCNLCETQVEPGQAPRWVKDGYAIYQCSSCGLIYRGDVPTPNELLSIYAPSYFRSQEGGDADGYADYLSDESEHRLTARRRVERLSRVVSRGRLLDVGAAAGFFIDEARLRGWDVQGIDVSPDMSAWGREHLGLDIATGLFQQSNYPADSFDALTMWDYIEHSIDPTRDFAMAARVLRRDGALVLSTGDAASLVARLSGKRWHLLTPRHHNFFFTVDTLTRFLRESGFEVLTVGHPSAHYSLRYLVHKLGTMAPRSAGLRRLSAVVSGRSLGERSVRLNLFDIATIVARRV